jgi:ribosomal protein S18 acetylase RimI-like enzyme
MRVDQVRTAAELASAVPRVAEFVDATVARSATCDARVLAAEQVAAWRWHAERTAWFHVTAPRSGLGLTAVLEAVAADRRVDGITVERHLIGALPTEWTLHDPEAWDWWSLRTPPAHRLGEARVERLGEADHASLRRLLDLASPHHWAPPGHPRVTDWWGVRAADDALIACVCNAPAVAGVPHLASVATHPDHRGQGLARDLVARASRDLFAAGATLVTLGSYADNTVAAKAYRDLGFAIRFRWLSARLDGPASGSAH